MKKIFSILLVLLMLITLFLSCDKKDMQCEHEYGEPTFVAEKNELIEKCIKCGEEKIMSSIQKPKIKYMDENSEVQSIEDYGKIELLSSIEGKGGLLGWNIEGVVYKAGTYFYLFKDTTAKAVYEGSSHTHAYELSSSTAPDCTKIGEYVYKCSCNNEKKIVAPIVGHNYSDYILSTDGTTQYRYCLVCGEKEETAVFDYIKGGNLLAIGDSLTEGKKVNGIEGSYAKKVAEAMGLNYVNKSYSGSEVYQWYSLFTGKSAPNGKNTTDINGLNRSKFVNEVKNAEVVIFTLGTNDITFYAEWRTVKQVYNTLFQLVDAMKKANPDLEVIYVGGAYGVNWLDGYPYNDTKDRVIEYNTLVQSKLKEDAYKSFCVGVDVSSVLSDTYYYQDVSYGSADYVHPGYKGNDKMTELIVSKLGKSIKE